MLLKLMFGIEAESPDLEMFRDAQARERTERLLMLADEGRIDEAENELSDILESCVPEHMQTGLSVLLASEREGRRISRNARFQPGRDPRRTGAGREGQRHGRSGGCFP